MRTVQLRPAVVGVDITQAEADFMAAIRAYSEADDARTKAIAVLDQARAALVAEDEGKTP